MQSIQELIQKFWDGETSEQENQLLLQWLMTQDKTLLEEDKAAFFKRKEEKVTVLEEEQTHSLLKQLHAQIDNAALSQPTTARVVPFRINKMWWVAASVIILLGIGIYSVTGIMSGKPGIVADNKTAIKRHVKTISNQGDTSMSVAMIDGSEINISARSAISFYEPFNDSSRNISLTGEATFKVAKDAKRPFTVFANGIATTALGTIFIVNTEVSNTVSVKLLEGKVVIRSVDSTNAIAMDDVYLTAGQQFTIDKVTSKFLVKRNDENSNYTTGRNNNEQHQKDQDVVLTFNNEPLTRVFHQLEKRYQVKIGFNEKEIAGLYFSGKILKTDSLATVLSAICNSNQLSFTREGNYIQITNQ